MTPKQWNDIIDNFTDELIPSIDRETEDEEEQKLRGQIKDIVFETITEIYLLG